MGFNSDEFKSYNEDTQKGQQTQTQDNYVNL